MKTIAVILICATGVVWLAMANNLHRKNKTVIYKTPGPVVRIGKPKVERWDI